MKTGRWICLLLALLLACSGALASVRAEIGAEALEAMVSEVVADESRLHADETAEIAAIEIADLDAPRDGAAFDTRATIIGTRADGAGEVSWQTPVVWTDLDGALADTARAGRTYMPFITLFVPESYALVSDDVRAEANITLPAFFAEATGRNDTLYFLEAPASGLVFITGEVSVPGTSATATGNVARSEKRSNGGRSSGGRVKPGATLEPELMVHTNARTVETYGPDYVRWLIETVKNVIEPKAVNMLIEAFPVYGEALRNGELSSGIGFYVERQQNTIAYVKCASLVYKSSGSLAGKAMRVVVNADFFAVWDADKGEYTFDESRRSDLEFTITHEILHATMYDYTTNGMLGVDETGAKVPENKFPTWFSEGSATAVDNAFSYRRNQLLYLCVDLDKYEKEHTTSVSFTPERLVSNYRRMSDLYSIDGKAGSNNYAYTSGYLASVYLMQLASEHLRDDAHVAGRESYQSGDMREGFNYILGELHSGRSLDQIIAAISPTGADGKPIYQSVADYQARFLGEGDLKYSAAFCASFLRYLESLSKDGKHSWGCILIEFDDLRDTLFTDGDAPVEALAYKIEDTGGYVKSDVPVPDSLNTGGATLPGAGDAQAVAKDENGDEIDWDAGEDALTADAEEKPEGDDALPEEEPQDPGDAENSPAEARDDAPEAPVSHEDVPEELTAPEAELDHDEAPTRADENDDAAPREAPEKEEASVKSPEPKEETQAKSSESQEAPEKGESSAKASEPKEAPAKPTEPKEEAPTKSESFEKTDAPKKSDNSEKEDAPKKSESPDKADAPTKAETPERDETPAKSEAPAKEEAPAQQETSVEADSGSGES